MNVSKKYICEETIVWFIYATSTQTGHFKTKS